MDIEARRNAFGRQVRSFEQDVRVQGLGDEPLRAVFIRAPWIEDAGDGVEVLAAVDGHPVVARERNMLVAAFHPELTDDLRLHALFLAMVAGYEGPVPPQTRSAACRRSVSSA
jgi:5'-phosphate synthase pdxT subunit